MYTRRLRQWSKDSFMNTYTYTERFVLVLMIVAVLLGFQSCLKPVELSKVMEKKVEGRR